MFLSCTLPAYVSRTCIAFKKSCIFFYTFQWKDIIHTPCAKTKYKILPATEDETPFTKSFSLLGLLTLKNTGVKRQWYTHKIHIHTPSLTIIVKIIMVTWLSASEGVLLIQTLFRNEHILSDKENIFPCWVLKWFLITSKYTDKMSNGIGVVVTEK